MICSHSSRCRRIKGGSAPEVAIGVGELGREVLLHPGGDVVDEKSGVGQDVDGGGDGAVVAAQGHDVAGSDLRGGRGSHGLQHPKRLHHGIALSHAPAVAAGVVGEDGGAVAGQVAVFDQDALAQDRGVGCHVEQGELLWGLVVEAGSWLVGQLVLVPLGPSSRPGDVLGQRGGAPLEEHVGEEQLLAVPVRPGDVGCSAGCLLEASILQAQPARSLLADMAVAAAEGAGSFAVVGLPPLARPAGPVVAGVDAPGQASLAGVDVLGAAGMASAAQALAEVVVVAAAASARWRCERTAGQAAVAVVDPGTGPRDSVGPAPGAGRRQPQRRVRARRWHLVLAFEGCRRGLQRRGGTGVAEPRTHVR